MGMRHRLELIDYDRDYFMFRDRTGTLVVLPRGVVKAIEFKEMKDEISKCVSDKDSKEIHRKKVVQGVQEGRECRRHNDRSRPDKKKT
jgi:hypothetical protein